jgi:hypothetical protein
MLLRELIHILLAILLTSKINYSFSQREDGDRICLRKTVPSFYVSKVQYLKQTGVSDEEKQAEIYTYIFC